MLKTYSEVETNGSHKIHCLRCPSLIMRPNSGASKTCVQDIALPPLKKDEFPETAEYWKVYDTMSFENIGFSKLDNEGRKYLLCADCELGPLGCQGVDEDGKVCFYLAAHRVRYQPSQ